MSSLHEVMLQLEELGSEQTRKVLRKHGAKDPFYGIKVGDLTRISKKIKTNHPLALQLWDTGNTDAMYLASMIADPGQMDKETLNHWADNAYWYMLSEYALASVTAESPLALKMAAHWIEDSREMVAAAGWTVYSAILHKSKSPADYRERVEILLDRVALTLSISQNRVRYAMNGFVISAGSYLEELREKAINTAISVGVVNVDMGGTACKVPDAVSYIKKTSARKKKV